MSKSVLIARLDNVGDVLLAGPAVRAVAASGAGVTILCRQASKAAAELLPSVDRIVTFDAPWVPLDARALEPADVLETVGRLSVLGIDEALILTSFHQSPLPLALMLRLAGVPVIAGISVDFPGALLDVRHHLEDDVHEVERNLSVAATLGYRLAHGDDGRLRVLRRPEARPPGLPTQPYVVVHPGASVPARAWPPARHAELVARLAHDGWSVVVTGAPSEARLCRSVASGVEAASGARVLDLSGQTDLAGLAETLAQAAAVVVGNTGPAHLAAAVGTPVVSLFAPTVPATRWRPWAAPHELLGNQGIPCAGCRSQVCPFGVQPCLSGVSVGEVAAAVGRLAASRQVTA
jgi:ADP-heptose:LPS heptosyltransferase